MSGYPVELAWRENDAIVEATLYDGMRPEDLLLVERVWGPERLRLYEQLLRTDVARDKWPESLHWDWSKKAIELGFLEATGFGIAGTWAYDAAPVTMYQQ